MNMGAIFQAIFIAVFVSAFAISGFFRRKARSSSETIPRRAEGGRALVLRLTLAALFFGSIVLHIVAPRLVEWAKLDLPMWLRTIGAEIAVVSVLLLYWVFSSIGSNISETVLTKSDHLLVTQGPYRWVRHPLYAVSLLMFFALGLMAASWLIMLYAIAGVVIFRLAVIPQEERRLVEAFGEEYLNYQHQTGAMLPRLT